MNIKGWNQEQELKRRRTIGWDDREAEEDRQALERWYARQENQEGRRRTKHWAFWLTLTIACDVVLLVWFVRHSPVIQHLLRRP